MGDYGRDGSPESQLNRLLWAEVGWGFLVLWPPFHTPVQSAQRNDSEVRLVKLKGQHAVWSMLGAGAAEPLLTRTCALC